MIIVTGASRGIGHAICQRLHEQGEPVLGIARNIESLPFAARQCDVTDYTRIKRIAAELGERQESVTALINAAGTASMNLALMVPPHVSEAIIATNLLGTIYCCQLFAPLMIRRKHGIIVNFSSIAVPLAIKGEAIYSASKAGVESFTRSFAREVASFGLRANCIAPGPIATGLLDGITKEQAEAVTSQQIIPRQFTTDDICDLIELLLDKRSRMLTGQVFSVGGI